MNQINPGIYISHKEFGAFLHEESLITVMPGRFMFIPEQTMKQMISRKKNASKGFIFIFLVLVYFLTVEAKDAEVNKLLQEKDIELEEMKKRLKNQERERQSELLKLQMEVNKKLHLTSNSVARVIL